MLKYKLACPDRKELVSRLAEITGIRPRYTFMPRCAYIIGDYAVEKDGTLIVSEEAVDEEVIQTLRQENLIQGSGDEAVTRAANEPIMVEHRVETVAQNTAQVELQGTQQMEESTAETDTSNVSNHVEELPDVSDEPDVPETLPVDDANVEVEDEAAEENAQTEQDSFCISLPKSKLPSDAQEKLNKILESKGKLIQKALGASSLTVERDEDKVSFPWFSFIPSAEQADAYTKFITALCKMAREQKRVSAKEKPNENEKYAFRCFLLRLGFIGDEFKKDRKILLRNFEGSSAFRTQESADKAKEKLEAKKAESTTEEGQSDGEV